MPIELIEYKRLQLKNYYVNIIKSNKTIIKNF